MGLVAAIPGAAGFSPLTLRLAMVVSHPIQHYAPMYREIAALAEVDLRVFFACRWGVDSYHDPEFGRAVQWDVPLTEGYDHEFLPIESAASPNQLLADRQSRNRERSVEIRSRRRLRSRLRAAHALAGDRLGSAQPAARSALRRLQRIDSHPMAQASSQERGGHRDLSPDRRGDGRRRPESRIPPAVRHAGGAALPGGSAR